MNSSANNCSANPNKQPTQPSIRKTNENIQVYVRVRPLNAREHCIRSAQVIDVISPREVMTRHSVESKLTKKFTFDRTFDQDSRQVDVYSTVVAPLIEEVLSGYNCTVFAYGQTGTGKTHTMVGTECAELKSSWEDDSDIGIIPRALSHLFDELRLMEMEFSMRISYLELYNEELCDLLSSDDSIKIRIFDDSTKKGSVIIQGLEEIPVHSKDDVYKLLEKGKERRRTATTLMNAMSSRSHTVFSILVHIRENGIDGEEMLKIGKLNLVDLAGSENVSKAGNEKGIRVRETVNINQSLLTLGRVITALVERTPHIPYRESKLTRLLQESLGGRTKTSIIATISPGHKDIEETLSTLEYAHRAKNIQNKPEVNQKLTKKTVLKEYTEEIDKLKRDLMAARDKNGIYLAVDSYNEMTLKMDSQNRELNEKMLLLKALKDELQSKEKIFNEVSLNLVEKTEELKRTEQNLTQTKGALLQTKKILNTTKRRYKEKKVLLNSHVKTEEALTKQATQILEVADTATNDTNQLHNTIERRKDVDHKIETACHQFSERMKDNFEIMDENLDNFQEQHNTCSQTILEELTNNTNVQIKLLGEANNKIHILNELYEQHQASTCAIVEKYAKALGDLGTEHKSVLEKLFLELKTQQLNMKTQIQNNLSDLGVYNDEQKSAIDTIRDCVVHELERSSTELATHTKELQQQIAVTSEIAKNNIEELGHMQKQIATERELAAQEQSLLEGFMEKMQTISQQRQENANCKRMLTSNLEISSQKSIDQSKNITEFAQAYCEKRRANNVTAQEHLEKQHTAALLSVDQSVAKCSTLQIQLNNFCEISTKQIDAFAAVEQTHCSRAQQMLTEKVTEIKHKRLPDEQKFKAASSSVTAIISDSGQQLKKYSTSATENATSLQNRTRDFGKVYKEQMSNCANDVANFKQRELKTYAPTGTTPSKKDYVYPRVLVATSPHIRIVKRIRQDNDWSDLDTTATIDEASEDEKSYAMQELSDTETILHSTPIVSSEEKSKSINGRNRNYLKPSQQHQRSNSLTKNNSPRHPLSRQSSPGYFKDNKENTA